MNAQQQQAVIHYATKHAGEHVTIDAKAGDPEGFDEVDTGVWVRGWVWVPQEAIDGYSMEPPAPAAVVEVQPSPIKPMGYSEFKDAYIQAYTDAGDGWTMANLRASWAAYQSNPAGHFLSKPEYQPKGNQS